ncbi:MAG: hypothetical protein ACRDZ4_00495 [Egibacteraceae bacterium]
MTVTTTRRSRGRILRILLVSMISAAMLIGFTPAAHALDGSSNEGVTDTAAATLVDIAAQVDATIDMID